MRRRPYIFLIRVAIGIVCTFFMGCTFLNNEIVTKEPSFKIATRQEIVMLIINIWPELNDSLPVSTNIAIPYGKYYLPTLKEVKKIIYETRVNEMRPEADIFMCADFALQLHAHVKILWREKGSAATIAFGEAWGTKFNLSRKGVLTLRGVEASHAVCFAVTRDYGLVLIEPTNGKIWKAIPGEDSIHFLKM